MSASPEISWSHDFLDRLYRLAPVDSHRALGALKQFAEDPDRPGLNLEKLNGRARNFWSIRASQSLRILLVKEGNLYFVVDVGPHDELYRRAERSHFIVDPDREQIRLVTLLEERLEPSPGPTVPDRTHSEAFVPPEPPLRSWSDGDLISAGLAPSSIDQIRACTCDEDLLALALEAPEIYEKALDLVGTTPDTWRAPSLAAEGAEEQRIRSAVAEYGALAGVTRFFTADEIAKLAAAPIEEWMVFLHPDQQVAVARRHSGPARVRGAAGTGKTVVGLHRAAALADRFRVEEPGSTILFTTFIKSLPPVFEELYHRLPNSRSGEVEFVHVDKLAGRICAEDATRPTTDPRECDAGFAAAYKRVVNPGTPLSELSRHYLREEIAAVIKGRGIAALDDYLNVARTGRRTRFAEGHRRQMWDLHLEFQDELMRRGVADFPDVVLTARDLARRRTAPTYRSVIIDEAQDLTLVGLQFVRALVNDPNGPAHDRLLILGDGAQRIYAGGYTLRQAGIDVRGRTTVLRTNYRNTAEILEVAQAVAGGEAVEDLAEDYRRSDEDAATRSTGPRPLLISTLDRASMWDRVAREINQQVDGTGTDLGDVAVLVSTNQRVDEARKELEARGIETLGLDRYSGRHTAEVKVGTYFRAKGLEFKAVFLPGLDRGAFPRPQGRSQSAAEYEEVRSLALSQLFVAMTRARDSLYVLAVGEPSEAIAAAAAAFREDR